MKKNLKLVPMLLCICLFAAFALGSGSSDSGSSEPVKVGEVTDAGNTSDSNTAVNITTENNEPEKNTASSTPTPAATNKTEYKVGETFTKDGLNITYVSSGDWESDNEFITPAEGKKFIRLLFHVDNQSKSDKSVTSFSFKCYADGYDCSQKYNDDDLSASLSSGRTADGAVYFEVPTDAKEIEVEYEYDIFSDKKVKFIFEGNNDSGLTFEKNTAVSANAFHVGDIIETKKLKITYLKAAEYKSDNMFLQPDEGNKYAYIELEFENLSDSDQTVSYFSFGCYADGSSCSGFYGMDDALSASISAGRKAKGTVAFQVPTDAATVEFEFEDNFWTESKIVFLYEEK